MPGREPDPIDCFVGAQIRLRRKSQGVTQQALAGELGVTVQQLQKYERGANRISASTLVKIARRLSCPVSALIPEEAPFDADAAEIAGVEGLQLLDAYSRLDPVARRAVLDLIRALVER